MSTVYGRCHLTWVRDGIAWVVRHGGTELARVMRDEKHPGDIAYSLALTDHCFSVDVLHQISAEMRAGAPHPLLLKEQEDEFRKAARHYVEKFGETVGLPPPDNPIVRRRFAKLAGWTIPRPDAISGLRWWAGFGWITVAIFLVPSTIAAFAGGTIRIFAVGAALAMLMFIGNQLWRYNGRGWRRIHYRAMLAYASISGREAARAEQEKLEFSKINACRSLALTIVNGRWREASVDAMIAGLVEERGDYLSGLIKKYGVKAAPRLDGKIIQGIADKIRGIEFGPELVIGNVVENTFGSEEAARYAIALVTRKAR